MLNNIRLLLHVILYMCHTAIKGLKGELKYINTPLKALVMHVPATQINLARQMGIKNA